MKKLLPIALIMVLALSLAACGGSNNSDGAGSTAAPPAASSTPAQTAPSSAPDDAPSDNSGNAADGWIDSFAAAAGIPTFVAPPECEVVFDANSPRTVTFIASSDITEGMFSSYAQVVFDLCRAASPDGIYTINYEGVTKGEEVVALSDVYSGDILMAVWYYTAGEYISQISLKAEGNAITVLLNDVYNQEGELAKP